VRAQIERYERMRFGCVGARLGGEPLPPASTAPARHGPGNGGGGRPADGDCGHVGPAVAATADTNADAADVARQAATRAAAAVQVAARAAAAAADAAAAATAAASAAAAAVAAAQGVGGHGFTGSPSVTTAAAPPAADTGNGGTPSPPPPVRAVVTPALEPAVCIPPEPPAGAVGSVTIAVRLPDGSRVARRWDATAGVRLAAVAAWVSTAAAVDGGGGGGGGGDDGGAADAPEGVHPPRRLPAGWVLCRGVPPAPVAEATANEGAGADHERGGADVPVGGPGSAAAAAAGPPRAAGVRVVGKGEVWWVAPSDAGPR